MVPGNCRLHDFTRHSSHTQPFLVAASSHGTYFTARWTGVTRRELSHLLRATPQMTRGSTGIRIPRVPELHVTRSPESGTLTTRPSRLGESK